MKSKYQLAVADSETDPYDVNGEYLPFVWGFFDGKDFIYFWDDPGKPGSCTLKFINFLRSQKTRYLIYGHNGGKFDWMFLLNYLHNDMHIQNGRIVKAHVGAHELRDSYSILPIPLRDFKGKHQKQKFADHEEQTNFYRTKFNRETRLKHKREIITYLEDDCLTLYEGVAAFRDEFGDRLTIGGTSMRELRKLHEFETAGKSYDDTFRPYYFGGRNQCFRSGIIEGDYKIYDVNSMYPYVMRNFLHPVSISYEINNKITKRTSFAMIEAKNYGCLPTRTQTGLDFTVERGAFYASIHEIEAGLETGTLHIIRIKHAIEHNHRASFATFVDTFYEKRLNAKAAKQEMLVTFYKLILNSAYGKFAQNPENYEEYIITQGEVPEGVCEPYCKPDCDLHWRLHQSNGEFFIWAKPTRSKTYFNVATAASITGASRAVLLRGLAHSVDPIYCDTDSIICRQLDDELDGSKLGAWKLEGAGSTVAIAGKKLYCVYDGVQPTKQASKGAIIAPKDIFRIASGEEIKTHSPVPHFKFNGSHAYVSRRLKATGSAKPFRQQHK